MSIELLYTSAPRGLRQGSRGFCTVLSTAGMPLNLANRLESLSGYRHLFPPQDPQAELNPVALSHIRATVAGSPLSVLSRVSSYGVDYSGRTNKIAHHIAIGPDEAAAAGPAWLLRQPGMMRTSWDGNCDTPPEGPRIPLGDQHPAVCHAWHSTTGDAGWGGVVAEAFASRSPKPVWIVYSLAQQSKLLELIDESIALLPVGNRWQATFSTYAANLSPDIDCRVRCIVEGTDEARTAAARGAVVDLTKALPSAPTSPLVVAARTGELPLRETTAPIGGNDFSLRADTFTESPVPTNAPPAAIPPLVRGRTTRVGPRPPAMPTAEGRFTKLHFIAIGSLVAVCILLSLGYFGLGLLADTPEVVSGRSTSANATLASPPPQPTDPAPAEEAPIEQTAPGEQQDGATGGAVVPDAPSAPPTDVSPEIKDPANNTNADPGKPASGNSPSPQNNAPAAVAPPQPARENVTPPLAADSTADDAAADSADDSQTLARLDIDRLAEGSIEAIASFPFKNINAASMSSWQMAKRDPKDRRPLTPAMNESLEAFAIADSEVDDWRLLETPDTKIQACVNSTTGVVHVRLFWNQNHEGINPPFVELNELASNFKNEYIEADRIGKNLLEKLENLDLVPPNIPEAATATEFVSSHDTFKMISKDLAKTLDTQADELASKVSELAKNTNKDYDDETRLTNLRNKAEELGKARDLVKSWIKHLDAMKGYIDQARSGIDIALGTLEFRQSADTGGLATARPAGSPQELAVRLQIEDLKK